MFESEYEKCSTANLHETVNIFKTELVNHSDIFAADPVSV